MPKKPQDEGSAAANSDFVTRLQSVLACHASARQAGEAAGLSPEQIGRWVTGRAEPRFNGVAALASLTGHSLDWLAYGTGPERTGAGEAADDHPALPDIPGLEERVRAAVGADTPSEFAARHGVDVDVVERALYGDLGGVVAVAEAVDWSLDWLVLGRPVEAGPSVAPAAVVSSSPSDTAPTLNAGAERRAEPADGVTLGRLVEAAVRAVDQQIASSELALTSDERANMTGIYFRALLRKMQGAVTPPPSEPETSSGPSRATAVRATPASSVPARAAEEMIEAAATDAVVVNRGTETDADEADADGGEPDGNGNGGDADGARAGSAKKPASKRRGKRPTTTRRKVPPRGR